MFNYKLLNYYITQTANNTRCANLIQAGPAKNIQVKLARPISLFILINLLITYTRKSKW